ncbi:unnamed protein product, partial [Adineta steineri]
YSKANDYFLITQALLKALNISTTDANAANECREAVKQKFKNERRLLQNTSAVVQRKKEKFGKGSGRFAKKSEALSAERKSDKMIYVSIIMDESDVEQLIITMKEGIKNEKIHNDELITLWKKTFGYRRSFIRSHTINKILEKFPGYSYTHFMFEEVKMIGNIDIEQNVNEILPRLFDKLPNNSLFVMDLLRIRVIKLLCKQFNQSISHILVDNEPIVPSPCIRVTNEKFELYLDWKLIIRATSPTTALALLCRYIIRTRTTTTSDNPLMQEHEPEQMDIAIETPSISSISSRIKAKSNTKTKSRTSPNSQNAALRDATNKEETSTALAKNKKRKLPPSPQQQRKQSSRLIAKRSRQDDSSF